jgi:ribose transport system ATP-binding protein
VGKSTLIKIMAGVVAPDEGRMLLDGDPVSSFASPAAANERASPVSSRNCR